MRTHCFAMVTLLGAFALAGCIGGEEVQSGLDDEDGDTQPAQVSETTGAVEGEVMDARSLEPVHDATVGALKDGEVVAQTTTDRQGRYAMSDLEPGAYTVTMNALGFSTLARATEVEAGAVSRVSGLLEALPTTAPYHELLDFEGFMAFGSHNPAFAVTSGLNDENHVVRFDFEVDPRILETVIIEAYWNNPNAGLRGNLWLNPNCDPVCAPDHEYAMGSGFGEFALRADHAGGAWPLLDGDTATLSLQVWSERDDEAATVAFQQRFTLYVGSFYLEPAAEGAVVAPDR